MRRALLIVTAFALVNCKKDLATINYEDCVQRQKQGDIQNAANSCMRAKLADPNSKTGKMADEKLKEMKPDLDRLAAAQASADAQAAAKRADEEKARLTTLRQKVRRRFWGSDRDPECTGKGLPPYRWDYEGGTYAEDRQIALADGCAALHADIAQNDYCCPQRP